jgi:hypothetical protein
MYHSLALLPTGTIDTRSGGPLVARANGTPTPFRVLDASGRLLPRPQATGSDGQPYPALRANAITAQAAAVSPLLSGYANGYPADNVDEVVAFFAPNVPAPVLFQYRNPAMANELGAEPDDRIGAAGLPQTVHVDPESLVSDQLRFRGLETPLTEQDRQLAEAMLGNSADRERQRRIRFLVGQIRRGRAQRTYELVQSTAGSATSLTVHTDEDPYKALRGYLETVILEAGSPEYVRVCMGYQVLSGFKDHPLANGVVAGLHHDVTVGEIAGKLSLPEENLMVSWHQVVTTKQGRSAAKSVLIGADQLYVFVCRPTPDEEDNSWLKTFTLAGQESVDGPFEVYTHDAHPLYENIGVKYWELQKNTNTSASAVKRLALTFSDSASA